MKIAIIIPTTGGPRLVKSLTPLSAAPRSVMRAVEDYVPLPTSPRYHAFLNGGGTLDDLIGPLPQACDLRLTGGIETGRSWEFPVALAHWLVREGHDLVTDDADVILWATGALDTDARLIAQDYHIADKACASFEMIAALGAGGARLEVLLPFGAEVGDACWPERHRSHFLGDLAEALTVLSDLSAVPSSAATLDRWPVKWSIAATAIGAVFASVGGWWITTGGLAHYSEASTVGNSADAQLSAQVEGADMVPPQALTLIALRAPEARICDHLRQATVRAEEFAVPVTGVHPIALPYERLCGLAVAIPRDGTRLSFAFGMRFVDRTSMAQTSVIQAYLNPGEKHRYWFIDFVPPDVPFMLDIGPADGSSPGSPGWEQISFEFHRMQ